jgi:hypothetical protein
MATLKTSEEIVNCEIFDVATINISVVEDDELLPLSYIIVDERSNEYNGAVFELNMLAIGGGIVVKDLKVTEGPAMVKIISFAKNYTCIIPKLKELLEGIIILDTGIEVANGTSI